MWKKLSSILLSLTLVLGTVSVAGAAGETVGSSIEVETALLDEETLPRMQASPKAQARVAAALTVRGLTVRFTGSGHAGSYTFTLQRKGSGTILDSVETSGGTSAVFLQADFSLAGPETFVITATANVPAAQSGFHTAGRITREYTTGYVCGCDSSAQGGYFFGDGSPGNPFLIASPAQLAHIEQHNASSLKQVQDIALSGTWTPISSFGGVFDGNGCSISGLRITDASLSSDAAGMFASVSGSGCIVKNAALVSPYVAVSSAHAGSLVAQLSGGAVLQDCTVTNPTVQASGEWYKVGGLVSNVFSGSALRCKVIGGTVKQLHTYGTAGGITGYSKDSSFVECASSATNTAAYTGGISGYAEGSIVLQNCRWTSPSHAVYLYGYGNYTPNSGGSFGNSQVGSIG